MLATVQSQSTAGAKAFAPSPRPMFRNDQQSFVDRDDLHSQLLALGFAKDDTSREYRVADANVEVCSWSSIKTCSPGPGNTPARCSMPPNTVAVRFFDPTWVVPDFEIIVRIGTYHRAELLRSTAGIGGKVADHTFTFKDGTWILAKVGRVFTSSVRSCGTPIGPTDHVTLCSVGSKFIE